MISARDLSSAAGVCDECGNCGEDDADDEVARKVDGQAEDAVNRHAEVEILRSAA